MRILHLITSLRTGGAENLEWQTIIRWWPTASTAEYDIDRTAEGYMREYARIENEK